MLVMVGCSAAAPAANNKVLSKCFFTADEAGTASLKQPGGTDDRVRDGEGW